MLRWARRRVLVWGAATVMVVVLVAGFWVLLGDERRAGRHASRFLTSQTGIPVEIERVARDGPSRWTLSNIHVPPGDHWSGDVRIRELRIHGGVLLMLAPRGRTVNVVALAPLVTLSQEQAPLRPPAADGLEAIRQLILRAIEWPATLALSIEGGELRARDQVFALDVKGEKSATGAVGLTMTVSPAGGPPALTVRLAGRDVGGRVVVRIGVEGDPSRLGAFAWPPIARFIQLTGEIDGTLGAGGKVDLAGLVQGRRSPDEPPAVLEFTSRYQAAPARLEVPKLALSWGAPVRLAGTATADFAGTSPTLTGVIAGEIEGSQVGAKLDYVGETGDLRGNVAIDGIEARRLLNYVGIGAPPLDLNAQSLHTTLSGTVSARQVRVVVQARLGALEARRPLPGTRFDGVLDLDATFDRGGDGLALARLAPTTLRFEQSSHDVIVLTGRSAEARAWPLAVTATIDDMRRLPSLPGLPSSITGRSVVTGLLDHTTFTGRLQADLPRIEVRVGRPVVATNMRIDVPVTYGAAPPAKPGTVKMAKLGAFGFALNDLTGVGQFTDGLFRLSDIAYVHYGGRGTGWIEASIDQRAVPLRSRIEGEHIDLGALTREYPLTVARLSGRVHYLLILQHSLARGINGAGQVASEDGGGEISIDAIEALIDSAPLQADPTRLVRQVLENLRVFKYASLDADVRVFQNGGHINLSIEGRKRLGLFPPPIKAINVSNVPLSLLARTFSRKETP